MKKLVALFFLLFAIAMFIGALLFNNTPKLLKASDETFDELPTAHDTVRIHDTIQVQDTSWFETVRYYKRQDDLMWEAFGLMAKSWNSFPPERQKRIFEIDKQLADERERHNADVTKHTVEEITNIINKRK